MDTPRLHQAALFERVGPRFDECKRKIENEEDPCIPPYSEGGESPFISERIEADASIQDLGSSCLSMLSVSLHLFLTELAQPFRNAAWPVVKFGI